MKNILLIAVISVFVLASSCGDKSNKNTNVTDEKIEENIENDNAVRTHWVDSIYNNMSLKEKVYMRDAAYMVAIDRVVKAMQLRGWI